MTLETELAEERELIDRPRRRVRVLPVVLVTLLVVLCSGSALLLFLLDQTALAAQIYIQSINSGNQGIAELMGDHFSDEQDLNRRFYSLDIQRDLATFDHAQLSDVT